MHLTVACALSLSLSLSYFLRLHHLPLSILRVVFSPAPSITQPLCFFSLPPGSLSICAHEFFTRLPSHNLIIRSKKQKNVLLLCPLLPMLHRHQRAHRIFGTSLNGDLRFCQSDMMDGSLSGGLMLCRLFHSLSLLSHTHTCTHRRRPP